MKSKIGSRDKRIESLLCSINRRLNATERQQATQNCDSVDRIALEKNKYTTGIIETLKLFRAIQIYNLLIYSRHTDQYISTPQNYFTKQQK